jgi:3-dehydroquinate synthase
VTARILHRERVLLPGRETDVWIGVGIRERVWSEVRARCPRARSVGFVVDETVDRLWPLQAPDDLRVDRLVAPAGEGAKCREVLADLQDGLLSLTRDEPVLAVGGGALLDVAGFAAATVRRGLPWIALPTTVVAMADASVGGKVAINHPRGKNLLGTFHPPRLVLADVATLSTLGRRDVVAGLAELYKAARIAGPDLLATLRRGVPASEGAWADVLAASIAVKARIVEADERDEGIRRLLNYGHTVGHALERLLGGEAMRHGEAVAIGMGVAARIARARGLVDDAWVVEQERDLRALGLPLDLPIGVEAAAVLETLGLDKKRRPGARHVFVLPAAEGLRVVEDVAATEIEDALRSG